MKRGLIVLGALVAGLSLHACATKPVAYGPVGAEAPYGYKDRPSGDGGFTVLVTMPAATPPAEMRVVFDRRAGELCPAGVARTNVFRVSHNGYNGAAPYVYRSAGVSQRVWTGAELEGYVYCKPAGPAAAH